MVFLSPLLHSAASLQCYCGTAGLSQQEQLLKPSVWNSQNCCFSAIVTAYDNKSTRSHFSAWCDSVERKMCDSQLGQPVTFLRQSHSFFRESFSIFCLSPSCAGVPLSAFFTHCCTLSCKLKSAQHCGKMSFTWGVSPH